MAYRLRCEPLEGRELLSGTPIGDVPGPLSFHCGPILADLTGDGLDDLVTRDLQGRVLLRRGLPDDRFGLPDMIGPSVEALSLTEARPRSSTRGSRMRYAPLASWSMRVSRNSSSSPSTQ